MTTFMHGMVLGLSILAGCGSTYMFGLGSAQAAQEARRNDAVGVDIVAGHIDAAAGDGGDFFESHGGGERMGS
mgnify:CR=1 FL=1